MDLSSIWQGLGLRDRRNLYIALTLNILGLTAGIQVVQFIKSVAVRQPKLPILPSPRKSLQLLSKQNPDDVPYPPDALPGARDVSTPYGNIRVYEWGPENGRKVLLVHGISTPSLCFAGMAKLLVERGCRVMMFDIFGRGYSDAPDPRVYKQDIRLFTSQILLVLASSKLAWTGSDRFAMVGYSMGGGISAAFTSYFPELVESLILVAPGGLIRPSRINRTSKLLYGNLLPEFVVNYFVRKRLEAGITTRSGKPPPKQPEEATAPAEVAESEIPDDHGHPANAKDSPAAIFPDRPKLSSAKVVSWQVKVHPGFLPSFISSIKNAPVSNEHERWRMIGRRCEARRASTEADKLPGLDEDKVLILLGAQDPVIVADETEEDATAALGKDNVKVVRLKGAHDVPIVNAKGCVEAIEEFWGNSIV